MTQIEVKVVIDIQDQRQVEALNNLVAALAGDQAPQIIAQAPEKAVAPKQEKPKAEKTKADPKKETKQEEPAPQEETQEDDAPEIKIEEVRALLAKKVENKRAEIKTKLTALGAPNVTALAKDKYPEFVDFLNGLK